MDIAPVERVRLTQNRIGAHTMNKADINGLEALQEKVIGTVSRPREQDRLDVLTARFDQQEQGEEPCPSRTDIQHAT
ncbi:hypothetical protein [Tritonibacter scottomollicae]|uniref:hypothetical protein n=1 Tax=Tritonibacter scottomollicae TaxID=483013 RepID=UPI003BAB56F5